VVRCGAALAPRWRTCGRAGAARRLGAQPLGDGRCHDGPDSPAPQLRGTGELRLSPRAHPTDVLSHEQLYFLGVPKGDETGGASRPHLSGDLATPKKCGMLPFPSLVNYSRFFYKTGRFSGVFVFELRAGVPCYSITQSLKNTFSSTPMCCILLRLSDSLITHLLTP
jgi:hypothetical protein